MNCFFDTNYLKEPVHGTESGVTNYLFTHGTIQFVLSWCFLCHITPFVILRRPSLKSSESQDGDKKRESRKGGFLNLIKSRSSKHDKEKDKDKDKERNQGSAPAQSHIPSTAVSQAASLAEEEPSSPKSTIRSPPLDTKAKFQTPPTNHSSSSERSEEPKTPDSVDSELSEGSPQGSRRYGMQVIGSGLLAEMKVKQEKRGPFCSHKVCILCLVSDWDFETVVSFS